MDKTNSKILTLSFAFAAALVGFTFHFLIKILASAFGVIARLADGDFVRHGVPVLVGVALFASLQFNSKVLVWGEEVISEIRKVVWPSRKDTSAMTAVVIIFLFVASLIVSIFDFLSAQGMGLLVR